MYEAESMFEITNNEERLDSFKLFTIFSSLNIVYSAYNYNINYCKKQYAHRLMRNPTD